MAAKRTSKKSGSKRRAPARTLSTRDLADALGVKTRIVQLWAREDGCPHGIDGRALRFDLAEVRTWLKSKGLDPRHPMGEALGGAAAAPAPGRKSKKAPAAVAPPAAEPRDEVARLRERIDTLAGHVTTFMGQKPEETAGVIALQQWSAAIKNLSHELRQLEAAGFAAEQRRGEWIRRADALASMVGLAEILVGGLDSLETAASARVGARFGGEDVTGATRDAAVILREEVDKIRTALARFFERVSEEYER